MPPPWWGAVLDLARRQESERRAKLDALEPGPSPERVKLSKRSPAQKYADDWLGADLGRKRIAVVMRRARVVQWEERIGDTAYLCWSDAEPDREAGRASRIEAGLLGVRHLVDAVDGYGRPIRTWGEWEDPGATWLRDLDLDGLADAINDGKPEDEDPVIRRSRVTQLEWDGEVLDFDGRWTPPDWLADPRAAADGLTTCSSSWGIGRQGGKLRPYPHGCGQPWCPLCAHSKAGRRAARWKEALVHLRESGYPLVHGTLTLRIDPDEDLPTAIARRDRVWAAVRGGSASKEWWSSTVLGDLRGREWTEDSPFRDGGWNVHLHVIFALYPDVDPDTWWERLVKRWCHAAGKMADGQTGAEPGSQARSIIGEGEDDVASAVLEVLKYPFKPCDMTPAGLLEALVTTKGRKHHQPGTGFHASSIIGGALAANPERREECLDKLYAARDPRALEAVWRLAEAYKRRDDAAEPFEPLYRRPRPVVEDPGERPEREPGEDDAYLERVRGWAVDRDRWADSGVEADVTSPDEGWVGLTVGGLEVLAREGVETVEVATWDGSAMVIQEPLRVIEALAAVGRAVPRMLERGPPKTGPP